MSGEVKTIRCWEDLLDQAHDLAKEKGWWENWDRPVDEQVANFHSEISEAWEEYRAGRIETWYSYHGERATEQSGMLVDGTPLKPEGFWVEIADLLIRLADTWGRYGWKVEQQEVKVDHSIAGFVNSLHVYVSWIGAADSRAAQRPSMMGCILHLIQNYPGAPSIWPIVNEKMAYNRTREYRHGGKAA